MRAKRLAALCLALVLTLSLLVAPAGAVSFTDMTGHWAREDVEYLAGLGIVKGTSNTTFSPDRKMTACEALLFCSRATGVSAADKAKIAASQAEYLGQTLPESVYSWAAEEMAVCLETGIITPYELESMCESGALLKSISRESLAMYLVRAMQLAPLANSLTSYPMNFADVPAITKTLQPYVYLLSTYGVVKGNESNQFMPQGELTRAEMATMLRRAIDFMDRQGISAELPDYTSYSWSGGVIQSVTSTGSGSYSVSYTGNLTGSATVTITTETPIYENNMRTTPVSLKQGQYIRVNTNSDGTLHSVRLGGALKSITGTVTSIAQNSLTLLVDGATMTLPIDRFTKIQVGERVGGQVLIDPLGGYTDAQCWVDGMGHLAELKLSGGTRETAGILTSLETTSGGYSLVVTAFNGAAPRYLLPTGAKVTVNGTEGVVSTAYVGEYVRLTVENDGGNKLSALAVETVSDYLQGSVASVYGSDPTYLSLTSLSTGATASYELGGNNLSVKYNGLDITLQQLASGSFATVQLVGNRVVLIDAYPASVVTRGTVASMTYDLTSVLEVRTADGELISFPLDMSDLPAILRDGKTGTLEQIRVGDSVTVTVRYNKVTTLEFTAQKANASGTIQRVVQDSSGVTIDVADSVGETRTYRVPVTATVTRDGVTTTASALRLGDQVALVVSGDEVLSVQAQSASTAGTFQATVLEVNTDKMTLLLKLSSGDPLVADLSGAHIVTVAGATLTMGQLKLGDSVQLYGSYSNTQFVATLVVRL